MTSTARGHVRHMHWVVAHQYAFNTVAGMLCI